MSSPGPDPFGFNAQCTALGTDTQLMTDTFANLINTTYTFRCCNLDSILPCADQPGPTFQSCSDDAFHNGLLSALTLCIGGVFEQHACAAQGCQQINWEGATSQRCAQPILDFMKVQPVGVQYACCDATSCTVGTDFACSSPRTLRLCITNTDGAECIDPGPSTICSGNYTSAAVGSTPQTPSGTDSSDPGTNSQSVTLIPSEVVTSSILTSSSSQSGLSPSDVATIVGSTLGGLTSLLAVGAAIYKFRKRKREKMNQPAPSESPGGQTEPTSA